MVQQRAVTFSPLFRMLIIKAIIISKWKEAYENMDLQLAFLAAEKKKGAAFFVVI